MGKRIASLVTSFLIIFYLILPVYALPDVSNSIIIKVIPGSDFININGTDIACERTFVRNDSLYIPLRLIMESFGAEVNWNGDGKINIVYRDVSADILQGKRECNVNQDVIVLQNPPVVANKTTMVPLELLEKCFGRYITVNKSNNVTSLILEDDGALSDLSFLTGAISKQKAGDSYFRWNINVPKGSVISSSSFNSKYILIENETREISLEVFIDVNKSKSIDDYLDQIKQNPYEYIDGVLVDSGIYKKGALSFIELLYNNSYDEAVVQRIYFSQGRVYNVILTSYNETNPWKLKDNKYYTELLNSFSLNYPSNAQNIQDLSKVKFGLVKYEEMIETDIGQKFITWEMDVFPDWDRKYLNITNPFITELGPDKKEYVSVEITTHDELEDIKKYAEELLNFYQENFNSKYYKFIDMSCSELAGYKSCKLIYGVSFGENKYIYEENILKAENLIYHIVIKSPETKYFSERDNYHKMLETLKIHTGNSEKLIEEIDKYYYSLDKNRVNKDDSITEYENKALGWSLKLPGYWMKDSSSESFYQSFSNSSSGAVIVIETADNSSQNTMVSDIEKFSLMNSYASNDNIKFVEKVSKGKKYDNVDIYSYRLENDQDEIYAEVKFHIINSGKHSFCLMSVIPDICATEKNLKEIQDILDSFIILPQT
jgi:uncharacterized protein (UPF0333 family)